MLLRDERRTRIQNSCTQRHRPPRETEAGRAGGRGGELGGGVRTGEEGRREEGKEGEDKKNEVWFLHVSRLM